MDFKEARDKINGVLTFWEIHSENIFRIISLVQENNAFFDNPLGGSSCLKTAADKLEKLIQTTNKAVHVDQKDCG